ncbi:MAG: T9SS type A sorting domain-containing protein [Flavobacteriales bacterium]|nr:T9SS type A sorting domain-containing protein [Flavobacteriales bacterium]
MKAGMKSVVVATALVLSGWSSVNGQSVGDYGSWVTGFWNTAGTWRVYDGSSWATSPAAALPPNANNNVYIRAGTTVTAVFNLMYYCNNLVVEPTGRLYNNNLGANNLSYVFVHGTDIVCNGNIGNGGTYDGISFSIEGGNVTISGTGTFNAARLNKRRNTHIISGLPMAVSNLTVSMLVTLRFANTALMNYGDLVPVGGGSTFNVTIAPTGTIAVVSGSVAIDGDIGADSKNLGGTITVNGTLLVQGTLYLTTNNVMAGGQPCRVTINSGGYVRATSLNASASGTATHMLTLNAGGTMEVTGTPNAWANYSVTNNTYPMNTTSQFIYSGLGGQDVRGVSGGYGHLRITGFGSKTLFGSTNVKGNLVIDNVSGAAVLDVSVSNFQVTVGGNWTNYNQSGFNEGGGLVLFNGTAGPQTITTTGGEQLNNWRIAKSSLQPLVTLGSNVQVAVELQMNGTGAIIDLNGRQLTLLNPSTAALLVQSGVAFGPNKHIRSERTDNTSRVRWDIGSTTGAHLVPFGTPTDYIPFTFNLTSGNAGNVTMATYGTPPDNLPWPTTPTLVTTLGSYLGLLFPDNRDATVDRFWQVDVTGTPTAELTFTYAPSELPIAPYDNPVSLRAQRWNLPSQLWETQLTGSAAAYWAVADVVSAFGPFTLSNIASPLPIELLQFDAQPVGEQVSLEWITATERANAYFTVLRSQDGITYSELERVNGAGTSVVPLTYSTIDPDPLPGLSYYKLRQTDLDGRSTESDAVPVRFIGGAGAPVLYPNPAREAAFIAGLPEGPAEVAVADGTGRIVARFRKDDDDSRVELPLGGLPAGHYVVTVTADQGRWALRLVRE